MLWSRSFGFRVGFMVVLLAGSVLAVFGITFLHFIRNSAMQQIDHEIRTTAEAQLRRNHPDDYWIHFMGSLSFVHGEEAKAWALRVTNDRGREVFRSANWPFVDFQTPTLAEQPPPEPSGDTVGNNDRAPRRERPPHHRRDEFEAFFFPDRRPPPHDNALADRRRPPRMKTPAFETRAFAGHRWRIGTFGNAFDQLDIARRLDDVDREMARLAGTLGLLFLLGLIFLDLSGVWIAHRTLTPIRRLTETARGITARGLDNRIDPDGAAREFAELIGVINDMLSRLEGSYTQAIRFSADAAHELKTPLTVLQGELDLAIQAAEPGSDHQKGLVGMLEEVQQLATILRKLLLLSRADGGNLPLFKESTDLSRTLEELAEDAQALDDATEIVTEIAPGIRGDVDPDLLQQLLSNLLSNAVKYKGTPGRIALSLQREADAILLDIENDGPVIRDDFRAQLFDRFTRGDAAHSRAIPGQGLGLSLAREIARAHGGELTLLPGKNRFRLTLPA